MPPHPKFTALEQSSWAGATWPLGAHVQPDGASTTFAVYSKHASRVILELYDQATGEDAAAEFVLERNPGDNIWRAKVRGAKAGTLYGFRCWGGNWPFDAAWRRDGSDAGFRADLDDQGNRYCPNKLLVDPYARELSHEKLSEALTAEGHDGGIYGWGGGDYRGRPRRTVDTGRWAPKSVVVADTTSTGQRPAQPAEDAAIYEAHVRNLTGHPSASTLRSTLAGISGFEAVEDVPPELRGTFAGAARMAPYLRALGFTAIELLPVQETFNGAEAARGREANHFNHWGYMTLGFFAPDRDYAHDRSLGGPTREFKEMVRAFHAQGIEVYLDVVFNHTAEGGNWGDLETVGFLSMGGLDTTEYYVLTDNGWLVDGATGCGNQVNFSAPAAQRLVLDALAYWVDEMGVDGFRFDLAPVLGRTPNAYERENWEYQKRFHPEHPLLLAIRKLGDDREVEMIAEAWDLWGDQVGRFPSGWGEWNGHFRDAVRSYLKGDGNADAFMAMVNGDYESFNDQGGPQKSVNFVTAHDGFTLLDLVSYDAKNNGELPPFGPSDGGHNNNLSWSSGGDHTLRRQRARAFWTVLFFSRGVPLVTSGDELGRTQNGNNNPWALNSPALWNNWAMAATSAPTALAADPSDLAVRYHDNFGRAAGPEDVNPLFRFAAFVARLRRSHSALRQRTWGDLTSDNGDVSYFFATPDGRGSPAPGDRALRLHVDGSGGGDCDFLLAVNMWTGQVPFTVPPARPGQRWVRIIDTAAWAEPQANCWAPETAETISGEYRVHPWSIVVLQEMAAG
jgi:glycogen operon protein